MRFWIDEALIVSMLAFFVPAAILAWQFLYEEVVEFIKGFNKEK